MRGFRNTLLASLEEELNVGDAVAFRVDLENAMYDLQGSVASPLGDCL